jgi:hypothetical protein
MMICETNCVVILHLTPEEGMSYFEKFGEEYWCDIENIVCIPLNRMNEDQIKKLKMFFACDGGIARAQYLIIEL